MTYTGKDRRKLNGEHQAIAKEAGREGAREVLVLLGVDVDNPRETQQDFAHLHRQRLASEEVGKHVRKATIGVVVAGVLGAVYMAFGNK